MQTFLPYPDFYKSLSCLDPKRLNKQKVEAYQILNTLEGKSHGWKNHPAVLQWVGYEDALKEYFNISIDLCVNSLGFNNSLSSRSYSSPVVYPKWLGHEPYHSSHRAALLFKNYEWYRRFGWEEVPALNYVWPSKIGGFNA